MSLLRSYRSPSTRSFTGRSGRSNAGPSTGRTYWKWLTARIDKPVESTPGEPNPEADPRYRAVVVGYGPVGSTLARAPADNGIEPTIIEMNLVTVRRLRSEGIHAVYGDAMHVDTLKQAGIEKAASLILTSSGMTGEEEVIRGAELNPNVRVLAQLGLSTRTGPNSYGRGPTRSSRARGRSPWP